ncbi:MAG: hypothetical protein ACI8X5_001219 [Planctomycetota bacterium]|jgi:hypothetical protein
MQAITSYLKRHPLVWLVPMIAVPIILALIFYLARAESMTPDNPFIYDL